MLLSSRALITGPSSRITANGGDDDAGENNSTGAGGGRMSIAVSDRFEVASVANAMQVRGGRNLGSETRTTLDGGAGTLFLQRPGTTLGELIVSSFDERNPASIHLTRYTPIASTNGALTFDAITVSGRALARFDSDYTVADASKVTHDTASLIVQPTDVPTVTLTTTPAAGADVIQGASIAATLNGSSIAGVGRIALVFTAGTPSPLFFDYSNTIPPANSTIGVSATAATGNATLKAIVTDRAGRTAETPVTALNVIANSAPVITKFDVTPPSLQMYAGHTIAIDSAASDDLAVTSLDLSTASGLTIIPQPAVVNGTTTSRSFSIVVPPTAASGASIDLKLSASDSFPGRAATTQTKAVLIAHDPNPPVITISQPASGQTFQVSSNVTIPLRAVITDAEVGVNPAQVFVSLDGAAPVAMTPDSAITNGWKADLPVPSVDGSAAVAKSLVITAKDYEGNIGTSAPLSINIQPVFDPNGPVVAWVCPSVGSGAMFPGGYDATVRATATGASSDNGVTSVAFYVGDSPASVAGTLTNGAYQATVTLPAGAEGTAVVLKVVATSIRGNVTTVTNSITLVSGTTINAATSVLAGDAHLDNQTLIITGATLTLDGPHTFTRLLVLDGGSLTHSPGYSA